MFLIERIIGITTFSIVLFIMANVISKCESIKSTKKILIIYCIILSLMGYLYYPYKSADLAYMYNLINTNLIHKNFKEIVLTFQNTGYSLYYIYYWIFGKIGNIHLLPAITALIFYSNMFSVLYKYCNKFNLSTKTMSRTILFFIGSGQFIEVISGIKSMLAFSILVVCFYNELVENKSFLKNLPLYIIAALMHDVALVTIGIRLVYLIFQKEQNFLIKIGHYIIMFLFLLFSIKYGKDVIMGASSKSQHYINSGAYRNIWEYIIGFMCDMFMIYSIYLIKKIMKKDIKIKEKLYKYVKFTSIILIIDMFFIFEYSIFHRYSIFVTMLNIPVVAILFEKNQNKEYDFLKKYYVKFQLYFFLVMGLSLIRGNLSSLKFFEFK